MCLILGALSTGCAERTPFAPPGAAALAAAAEAGWARSVISANGFRLLSLRSAQDSRDGVLSVYIEGDGDGWVSRNLVARDPTPRHSVALGLALRDPGPAAYLARPCQYAAFDAAPDGPPGAPCEPGLWSTARYGEATLEALDEALDRLRAETGAAGFALVGYSGGGALATLLAARRSDVVRLVTVAAVLDHAAWTAHHEVSPLADSFNPAEAAPRLGSLIQLHLFGEEDDIVPPRLAQGYRARLPAGTPARFVVLPGADHDCCWEAAWPAILAGVPEPMGAMP